MRTLYTHLADAVSVSTETVSPNISANTNRAGILCRTTHLSLLYTDRIMSLCYGVRNAQGDISIHCIALTELVRMRAYCVGIVTTTRKASVIVATTAVLAEAKMLSRPLTSMPSNRMGNVAVEECPEFSIAPSVKAFTQSENSFSMQASA